MAISYLKIGLNNKMELNKRNKTKKVFKWITANNILRSLKYFIN